MKDQKNQKFFTISLNNRAVCYYLLKQNNPKGSLQEKI